MQQEMLTVERTDNDCTLWVCEACRECGVLTFGAPDVYMVMQAIAAAHRSQSPNCDQTTFLRVVKPESWYKDARSLYYPNQSLGESR